MTQPHTFFLPLLRLQINVLALGESPHAGWWKSQFLARVGLSYLSRPYPRGNFAAAVRSASRAARAVHDNSLGIGNVFHLFRLPQDMAWQLDELLRQPESDLLPRFEPLLDQRDNLLEHLKAMGGQTPGDSKVGPLRLGTVRDLRKPDIVSQLSAVYYTAFRDDGKVFPYFEDDKRSK